MTEPPPNITLAITGGIMIGCGLAGFFLELNTVTIGILLPLGAFLMMAAAFSARLEGKQELPGGGSLTIGSLAHRIEKAEQLVAQGEIMSTQEVLAA